MLHLNSGIVEVYAVYTNESHCRAVAESVKHSVQGRVSCVSVPL